MPKKLSRHGAAVLMLFITSILWSTSGFLIKLVDWHPMAIAGVRSAIALIPIIIAYGPPKRMKGFTQIGAAVCYSVTLLLFVSANKMTTAANVILLQYSAPIYVIILSGPMLKEKVKLRDVITVCVVVAGLALFFFEQLDADGIIGNILALVSAVTLAFMMIFLRKEKDGTPMNSVIWGNIFTFIAGLPFIFTNGTPDSTSWIGLTLLGLFQLGLSYVIYMKALPHITTVETALVPIIEPLLSPTFVALTTGEIPGALPFVGGLIVVTGVTVNLAAKRK